MAEFPALTLWTDAYLGDTRHLSLEEHGAYLMLLMIMWRDPDCSVPDDDQRIAIMLGVTKGKWTRKLRPALIGFFTIEAGRLRQKRLEIERKNARNRSKKQSDRSRKRWDSNPPENNDNGPPVAYPADTSAADTTANPNHCHWHYQEEYESKPPPSESPTHAAADEEEVQHTDRSASPVEVQPPGTVSAETMAELIERCPMLSPQRVRREVECWVRSTGSAAETERIILLALRTARDPIGYASRVIGRKSADVVEAVERGRTIAERPEPPPFKSESQRGSELFLEALERMEAQGHG